jgi:hypothetical protein
LAILSNANVSFFGVNFGCLTNCTSLVLPYGGRT